MAYQSNVHIPDDSDELRLQAEMMADGLLHNMVGYKGGGETWEADRDKITEALLMFAIKGARFIRPKRP